MIAAKHIMIPKEKTYWGLCLTAEQANSTVAMAADSGAPDVTLLYTTDRNGMKGWGPFRVGSTTITLSNVGDRVWFRAGADGNPAMAGLVQDTYTRGNYFTMTGRIAASGSVMSLLNGDEETFSFEASRAFSRLFRSCASLTKAPDLPATTLENRCYAEMFEYCTSLTTAPHLPATTLVERCYSAMFYHCTSLNSISVAFGSFVEGSSVNWVNSVAAEGTFYCPTQLGTNVPGGITRGANACPEGWTVVNTD